MTDNLKTRLDAAEAEYPRLMRQLETLLAERVTTQTSVLVLAAVTQRIAEIIAALQIDFEVIEQAGYSPLSRQLRINSCLDVAIAHVMRIDR